MSQQNINENDIKSKITDWLNTQGYPLEMGISEVLQKYGFEVLQSEYYVDNESNQHREIDIVASIKKMIGKTLVRFSLIIECKLTNDKPWVIFTSQNSRIAAPARVYQRAASISADNLLSNICQIEEIQKLSLFDLPERPGYGLTQAFTSGKDVAYNSCISVSKAAKAIASRYDKIKTERYLMITFPVIVIEGRLFESYLYDKEMYVSEIDNSVLLWRNPILDNPHTVINILTKNYIEEFVMKTKSDFMKLFEQLEKDKSLLNKKI